MNRRLAAGLFCALACLAIPLSAADLGPRGPLLIVGGGLRPDNNAVLEKLIAGAGGREAARFVLFPCAGKTNRPAKEFAALLAGRGIASERITILDLMPENAAQRADDPALAEQIRAATGAFFTGGDQIRILQCMLKPDGSPTGAGRRWRPCGGPAGSWAARLPERPCKANGCSASRACPTNGSTRAWTRSISACAAMFAAVES